MLLGTKALLLAGLLGFVFIAWLVELISDVQHPVHLGPLLAAAFAGIPAVLWLGFFYLMDRHEPEPKQLVAGVSVLGCLIAAPLADFLIYQAVPPGVLESHDLSAFSPDRWMYAVLVVGLAQEMCKYATVRYTIYLSREFDEPMDGVVYMMACGTGFAVWVNYHRMSGQGHQIQLSIGAAQAVVTTLAHASFAGVLGFVLGKAKFSQRSSPVRTLFLVIGLFGAAALNGQFAVVENWLQQSGMGIHPWRSIGYTAAAATSVFVIVWIASRYSLAASPYRSDDR